LKLTFQLRKLLKYAVLQVAVTFANVLKKFLMLHRFITAKSFLKNKKQNASAYAGAFYL